MWGQAGGGTAGGWPSNPTPIGMGGVIRGRPARGRGWRPIVVGQADWEWGWARDKGGVFGHRLALD